MIRSALRLAPLLGAVALALPAAGCAAPQDDASAESASTQDQGLTAAQTRAAIEASVGPLFVEPCGTNRGLTKRQVPRALRARFKADLAALKTKLVGNNDLDDRFIDDYRVYAVYTSRSQRTLAGYALRVSSADGSSFVGIVAGYSPSGARLFAVEDFAQDDQDIEEPIDCR
jgi:hypothetical protein